MAQGATEDVGKIPMSLALQATLVRAREYASAQSHAQVTLEHLLLSLTEDEESNAVLQACRLDLARLRNDVAAYLGDLTDRVPSGSGAPPAISVALTQVLGYATLAAKQGKRQKIDGAIVLAALIGDGKSMAASFLTAQGLTFQEIVRVLQRTALVPSGTPAQTQPLPGPQASPTPASPFPSAVDPVLSSTPPAPQEGRDSRPLQTSRTESILAAARERIEARTQPPSRTGPPTAAPTAEERPVLATLDVAAVTSAQPSAQPISLTLDPGPGEHPENSRPTAQAVSGLQTQPTSSLLADRLATLQQQAEPRFDGPPSRPVSSWAPPPLPAPVANTAASLPRPQPPPAPQMTSRPVHQSGPPQQERRPVADVPVPAPWADPEMPSSQQNPGQRAGMQRPNPQMPDFAPSPSQPNQRLEQYVAAPAQRRAASSERSSRAAAPRAPQLPPIDAAEISHTVPLRLRAGRPVTVEVKVGRPAMAGLNAGPNPASLRSELVTARAVTVRVRPAKPNLAVEALSPETLWDQNNTSTGRLTGEAAVWRFSLKPKSSGAADILLLISARTVAADGVIADMTIPDMVIEAKIARNWGHLAKRIGIMLMVVVASIAASELLRFGLGIDISALVRRILR